MSKEKENLKAVVAQVLSEAESARGESESNTRNALVLPIIDALGYGIRNIKEVYLEYDADFAAKKAGQKEKVDIAILRDGKPIIYIEVKSYGSPLAGHEGQLARYFNSTTSVCLGILTDGIEWRFYTDTMNENMMDREGKDHYIPFLLLRLNEFEKDVTDQGINDLWRFSKSGEGFCYEKGKVKEYAQKQLNTKRLAEFLRQELDGDELSEDFVAWILKSSKIPVGNIGPKVKKDFAPIIMDALKAVKVEIGKRSVEGMKAGATKSSVPSSIATSAELPVKKGSDSPQKSVADNAKAEPTEEELKAFAIVKGIFEASPEAKALVYDSSMQKEVPVSLSHKATTAYQSVLLNGKVSWWALRFQLDGKKRWLALNIDEATFNSLPQSVTKLPPWPIAQFRIKLESVEDMQKLKDIILAAFRKTIQDRKA